MLGIRVTGAQVGDDKTRIGLARQVFRLADHPPFTGPGFARAVAEVTETPGGLAGALTGQAGRFHFFAQGLLQALVARQTQNIAHVVGLAPGHDRVTAETRVCANDDPRLWPTCANLTHDALQFVHTA